MWNDVLTVWLVFAVSLAVVVARLLYDAQRVPHSTTCTTAELEYAMAEAERRLRAEAE